jgi:hypothetical protein
VDELKRLSLFLVIFAHEMASRLEGKKVIGEYSKETGCY